MASSSSSVTQRFTLEDALYLSTRMAEHEGFQIYPERRMGVSLGIAHALQLLHLRPQVLHPLIEDANVLDVGVSVRRQIRHHLLDRLARQVQDGLLRSIRQGCNCIVQLANYDGRHVFWSSLNVSWMNWAPLPCTKAMMQWNCIQIEMLIDEDDHSMSEDELFCFCLARKY